MLMAVDMTLRNEVGGRCTMARNRRRSYEDAMLGETADGIPCAECGCRHSYVIRTERIAATVRRTRQCRNCGRRFFTSETS